MKAKRMIAIIISLTIVFVTVFSLAFIIAEADHDCAGEGCPICQSVGTAEDSLKKISSSVLLAAVSFAALFVIVKYKKFVIGRVATTNPVLLKVKLSD